MICIIGVISSAGYGYESMKEIWFENVNEFNKSNENDKIYLFYLEGYKTYDMFLEDKLENINYSIEQISNNNIYKFKIECKEIFENLLKKSLVFFNHIEKFCSEKYKDEYTFVIRSNLSTLFNFNKLFRTLKNINTKMLESNNTHFMGGSIINSYHPIYSGYSGTNISFTINTLQKILIKSELLLSRYKDPDDLLLSAIIFQNYKENLLTMDYKLICFLEDMILFKSINNINDDSIFCYRFKTNNREDDSKLMKILLDKIYKKDFNLLNFINEYKNNRQIATQNSEYANNYSLNCFKFTDYIKND